MSFPSKTLTCDCDHSITVVCDKYGDMPNHSYHFVAFIGEVDSPERIRDVEADRGDIVIRQSANQSERFCVTQVDETNKVSHVAETFYEHVITVGPVDGPVTEVTLEQFQADVDAAREHAANHCHMRHIVKELESQIK